MILFLSLCRSVSRSIEYLILIISRDLSGLSLKILSHSPPFSSGVSGTMFGNSISLPFHFYSLEDSPPVDYFESLGCL